jgi:hypothetical protein
MDSFVLCFPVIGNRGVVVGDPEFVGRMVAALCEAIAFWNYLCSQTLAKSRQFHEKPAVILPLVAASEMQGHTREDRRARSGTRDVTQGLAGPLREL